MTTKPEGFDAWLAEVKAYGLKHFAYDQSEGYEEADMIRYFNDGDTPKEWCEWHADKYDLTRADGPWGGL